MVNCSLERGEREQFTDDRLADTLDHLYKTGLELLCSAIMREGIESFGIGGDFLHQDITSIKLFGMYEGNEEEMGPEVTNGFSKDHRADLKQVTLSMAISDDGGIPILGRIDNGNRSDHEANRFQITDLRKYIPALKDATVVGDCKLFDTKSIGVCIKNSFHFIPLVPERSSLRQKMINRAMEEGGLALLKEENGRKKGEKGTSHGISFFANYEAELPSGKKRVIPMRFLVIKSSQLSSRHEKKGKKSMQNEVSQREEQNSTLAQRAFACIEDAQREFEKIKKRLKLKYHKISVYIEEREVVKRRSKKGRPAQGEEAPGGKEWSLQLGMQAREDTSDDMGYVVLATNRMDLTDREVLNSYKAQYTVEGGLKWLKGSALVAPIFLKKPKRIAALGFVFLLSLLVNNLVQREIRTSLKEKGEKIPGNNNVMTSQPTTQVVFRTFEGISLLSQLVDGKLMRTVINFKPIHRRILSLLNLDKNLYLQRSLKKSPTST